MVYAATTFKYVFDYKLDDVYFCTADIGWVRPRRFGVCVRARRHARVYVRVRARVCVCVCVCVCLRVCVLAGVDAHTALPPLVGASSTAFAAHRCDGLGRSLSDAQRSRSHTAHSITAASDAQRRQSPCGLQPQRSAPDRTVGCAGR